MDICWRQRSFAAMKISPEGIGDPVEMNGAHIDIAGLTGSFAHLRQKCFEVANGIEHMATDHNIGAKIIRGLLPGGRNIADIGKLPPSRILTQKVEHGGIWLDGDDLFGLW